MRTRKNRQAEAARIAAQAAAESAAYAEDTERVMRRLHVPEGELEYPELEVSR